jgi:hypothetical protein
MSYPINHVNSLSHCQAVSYVHFSLPFPIILGMERSAHSWVSLATFHLEGTHSIHLYFPLIHFHFCIACEKP